MRMMTIDEALNLVAEVAGDNKREMLKSRFQRRTEYTDLYGVPFYAESDENNEAKFFISISPDLVYMMRFQCKIYITGYEGDGDDFTIELAGADITDYLIAQQDGDWIDGDGLFPSNAVEDETDFYDIMEVASVLYAEGDEDTANDLLKPGFKQMVISSDAPFSVTMYLYCKYSTTAR